MEKLTFDDELLARPAPSGFDVITTLAHFAIVTYLVPPEKLRPHVHERFELDLVQVNGRSHALVSVVPFVDQDFRFVRLPWFKWRFEQTNYRAYVRDRQTGEHVVWFFGTALNSWTVSVPNRLWRLPWHRTNIQFACEYDGAAGRYRRYEMRAQAGWATATLALRDTGQPPTALAGFDDLETGLVLLTHPRKGYYYRQDGRLGSYAIWHDRLHPTVGEVKTADFALLTRLGLVPAGDVSHVHTVLLQPQTEFVIYLPPVACE